MLLTILEEQLRDFEEMDGGGAYTDIQRARCYWPGVSVVIRRWRRELSEDEENKLQRLLGMWARLTRRHRILGFCRLDHNRRASIVVPFYPKGNIIEYLERHSDVNDVDVLTLFFQVAAALANAHSMSPPLIHGNVRGSNILIHWDEEPIVTDFGLRELNPQKDLSTACRWLAPEILYPKGGPWVPGASDVYSFGMTMLEVCTGSRPFKDISGDQVMLDVSSGQRPKRPSHQDCKNFFIADNLWNIITDCWKHDPADRPTMNTLYTRLYRLRGSLAREWA
ncbi:hypothetical protein JAAARDRAFT_211486 [Jaapia argillacea MUCL 33604]|uniref:Protein kinase domain-containing protein n=1 Tax=Jaapia argillacea MUCL 33604 TaxID=933084 RepID=A0A067PJZ6_9AGAM|nr:hypothetical protein JAAARDRAFT_211486 [Jaapia argillacea MUCL 33604]